MSRCDDEGTCQYDRGCSFYAQNCRLDTLASQSDPGQAYSAWLPDESSTKDGKGPES